MSESDKDFNLEELEKMSQEGLEHFNDNEAISNIESETFNEIATRLEEKQAPQKSSKFLKAIILLAILLVLSFLLISKFGSNDSNQKLYASNYSAPPFLLSSTERNSDSNEDAFFKIKNLYTEENYTECLHAINQDNGSLLKINPDLRLYQGICLLEAGKAEEASKILSNTSGEIEDVRLWYLGLAQVANGDTQAAQNTLASLIKLPGNYKKKEAKAILEELE